MSLPTPIDRDHIHTRHLDMKAYRRSDGLFDLEGRLTDAKPHRSAMGDGWREPGEYIHDLWIRLTINMEMEVLDAVAAMPRGAYPFCELAAPNFTRLKGLKIGPGWNKAVRERVGGTVGCTHIVEMLAQIATTAMQAVWSERHRHLKAQGMDMTKQRPNTLDSCHGWRSDGPVVRDNHPDFYTGPTDGEWRAGNAAAAD